MRRLSVSVLALLLSFTASESWADSAKKVTGLHMPESVVVTKDGRIFVSEIGEFGKDGDGQITRIEANGSVSVFAKGMNDPKGLAYIGDTLYVADKTRIIKVASDGSWREFVSAEAFPVTPQFLNDLEPDTLGNLYVSDSGDLKGTWGAIYRINPQGKVAEVIDTKADSRVGAPNGLLMDDTGHGLIFVDFASGVLYSYNMVSKQLVELANGFGGGDGVVHHPSGWMYVSDWKNGKVFRVIHDEVKQIASGFQSAADIAITPDSKALLVPDMKAGELVWIVLKP